MDEVVQVRSFKKEDVIAVQELTDREIGQGYYNPSELREIRERSIKSEINCSLVLESEGKIRGVRLTYPQGNWTHGKGKALLEDQWPHSISETAYFQSLFVAPVLQNQGWGKRLSLESILRLKNVGARGVVCHSWKESPGGASYKYLLSLGFEVVGEHSKYWNTVDYIYPRCGKPCVCTAQEMYLQL